MSKPQAVRKYYYSHPDIHEQIKNFLSDKDETFSHWIRRKIKEELGLVGNNKNNK